MDLWDIEISVSIHLVSTDVKIFITESYSFSEETHQKKSFHCEKLLQELSSVAIFWSKTLALRENILLKTLKLNRQLMRQSSITFLKQNTFEKVDINTTWLNSWNSLTTSGNRSNAEFPSNSFGH
jgi:hypothetical protein